MSVDRLERVNALLRREVAEALFKVLASERVDMAAITVTRVETARNLRHAAVYVSIRGHEHERGTIMGRLARQHGELQRLINRDLTLKYTPRLEFRFDPSVAQGDHILDVLAHLDEPQNRGQGTGDGDQGSEGRGQRSEVRGQRSEVGGQEPRAD